MKLSDKEIQAARGFMDMALEMGADKCRVSLSKSEMDLVATLDGRIDRISHSMDRSLTLSLFKGGKYGAFSTNRLDGGARDFVAKALEAVEMMAEDPCRDLPPLQRTERSGEDAGLLNEAGYEAMTMEKRMAKALDAACYGEHPDIISEEGEYSDSLTDLVVMDSQGAFCRHTETAFEYASEVTVSDNGSKVSSYWWDSALSPEELDCPAVGRKALSDSLSKRSPKSFKGGKMTVVVEAECASKLLSPLISAMNGFGIQQNNSFLTGKLGEKLFPDFLDIIDRAREKGATGARFFDTEGVATTELPLVEGGVLRNYLISTYIAGKTGLPPTVGDVTRPCVCTTVEKDGRALSDELLAAGKRVLRITGFNGGNCNSATGDFSFGVEGFLEGKDGPVPVRECVMTGNMLSLWANLAAVGNDARKCRPWQVPALVFEKVDISS